MDAGGLEGLALADTLAVDLDAGVAKPVPPDDQMVATARNIGISFGD